MAPTLESLGIDRLSVDDRISLALAIWDSINEVPAQSFLTDAKRAELERRLADHIDNPNDVVSWEQVRAEALGRFQR